MPSYAYHCKNVDCHHNKEPYKTVNKISEHPQIKCPLCSEPSLETYHENCLENNKVSVIFKGNGWFNKGGY